MRALLDTHAFLWASASDSRLSDTARELIASTEHEIYLSAVSAWEIAIKFARGRMPELAEPPEAYLPKRVIQYSLTTLSITFDHAFHVARLPRLHRDPFDRLLIAQAQVESLPIITSDPNIARYDVEVIW